MKHYHILFACICIVCSATTTTRAQFSRTEIQITPVEFNSEADDFSAALTQNGRVLYFTSDREEYKQQRIMRTERNSGGWASASELYGMLNSSRQSGAPALTSDGQYMVFSASLHTQGGVGRTDLYSARRVNGVWSDITNLGTRINSDSWDSQPTISGDGTILIFASDRPGGSGGTDLYICRRSGGSGDWSAPEPLRAFNTPADEMSPSLAADNTTFYFSSNRPGGQGGYDIYASRLPGSAQAAASIQSAPLPINSAADEYFYTALANSDNAYMSRTTQKGDLDIVFITPNPFPADPVLMVQGVVKDAVTGNPIGATIIITDLKTGRKMAELRSDDKTGEYYTTLPAGRSYSLTATKPGYVFYSERYDVPPGEKGSTVNKDISLSPLNQGNTRLLVFFDFDKADLKEESTPELERLIEFLKDNPALKISVEGHTDDKGAADYNKQLSLKRAESVKNYLITAGIEANRVSSKGWGSEKPLVPNTNDQSRAMNRRVEMKIL
jgi:outer membrane protein OmpA-like peptidoglycan-associated protein